MELTTKQAEGLSLAIKRFKDNEKFTVIGGYAGTGKSTLVRFIIEALASENLIDINNDICYCSFTGKATQVLSKKGNKPARTLCKLLYDSIPKKEGGYMRIPYKPGEIEYKLIIVDEASMVPSTLVNLLFEHPFHIIFLGDPFQLPPISDKDNNHLLDKPHIFLNQIMRQAEESEIIRLTMKIRNGEPIDFTKGNEVIVTPREKLNTGMLTWADEILTATNATRCEINNTVRKLLGRDGDRPETGDKIIIGKNNWNIEDSDKNALVNGTIGYLSDNVYERTILLPRYLKGNVQSYQSLSGSIETEYGTTFNNLILDKNMLKTGTPTLDWKTSYALGRSFKTKWMIPEELAWGYAITCHRAQGSEWNKVLVIEEGFPYTAEEHARWLYTACTRASEKLVLVR